MKSRAISFLETSVRRLVLFSDGSQFNHQFIRDFVSMVLQRKHVQTLIHHRFSMSRNRVTFHRVKEFSIISTKFFCSTESNMNAILLWDTWTSWIYNELVISVPLAVRYFLDTKERLCFLLASLLFSLVAWLLSKTLFGCMRYCWS